MGVNSLNFSGVLEYFVSLWSTIFGVMLELRIFIDLFSELVFAFSQIFFLLFFYAFSQIYFLHFYIYLSAFSTHFHRSSFRICLHTHFHRSSFCTDLFDRSLSSPWHAEAVGELLGHTLDHRVDLWIPGAQTGSQTGSLDPRRDH